MNSVQRTSPALARLEVEPATPRSRTTRGPDARPLRMKPPSVLPDRYLERARPTGFSAIILAATIASKWLPTVPESFQRGPHAIPSFQRVSQLPTGSLGGVSVSIAHGGEVITLIIANARRKQNERMAGKETVFVISKTWRNTEHLQNENWRGEDAELDGMGPTSNIVTVTVTFDLHHRSFFTILLLLPPKSMEKGNVPCYPLWRAAIVGIPLKGKSSSAEGKERLEGGKTLVALRSPANRLRHCTTNCATVNPQCQTIRSGVGRASAFSSFPSFFLKNQRQSPPNPSTHTCTPTITTQRPSFSSHPSISGPEWPAVARDWRSDEVLLWETGFLWVMMSHGSREALQLIYLMLKQYLNGGEFRLSRGMLLTAFRCVTDVDGGGSYNSRRYPGLAETRKEYREKREASDGGLLAPRRKDCWPSMDTDTFESYKASLTQTLDKRIGARIRLQLRDPEHLKFLKSHHKAILRTMLQTLHAHDLLAPRPTYTPQILIRNIANENIPGYSVFNYTPLYNRHDKIAVHEKKDYDSAWAWLLNMTNVNHICARMHRKSFDWSTLPKETVPTPKQMENKIGWFIDPGCGAVISARVDVLTPCQKRKIRKTIDRSRKPATVPPPDTDYLDDNGYEYPHDKDDNDDFGLSRNGKRLLFLDTFASDKLPILNLSISGYSQSGGFIQAPLKLTKSKRRWGIKELESDCPPRFFINVQVTIWSRSASDKPPFSERAFTDPAAVTRLKIIVKVTPRLEEFYDMHCHCQQGFCAYHLRQKALSRWLLASYPGAQRKKTQLSQHPYLCKNQHCNPPPSHK
ncbi:hypothetical protein BDK51DRAFT_30961 [Blyttiomyces helicus]|uniref:Uncharacterized protein n=1 Tax=Blyttiomyces helicus TaxID=388810 RepID=A0A4P9WUL5_9FUNG|nr:hypothetical protein BDK51DRAFT_30961 [Blyttiomyces helicus]|eukprot:RKO94806.1 hypothetical protein BDK51DRAFT_30961 [Blyttiomyces helicus]